MRLRPHAQVTGLAVVRGASGGLLIVGVVTGLQWVGVAAGLSRPSIFGQEESFQIRQILDSFSPATTMLAASLVGALATGLTFGLVLAFLRRWVATPLALVTAGGVLILVQSPLAKPLDIFNILGLLTAGCLLMGIVLAYDVLTGVFTMLTSALWVTSYTLSRIHEVVGNWQFWLPLLLWGTVVAWGVYSGFRPVWGRAGRRVADAF